MEKQKNVPALRFLGFEGNWEEKKLGEVSAFTNGKGHENDISESGKYIVINSKFISTDGAIKKYSDKAFSLLHKEQIVMVMSDVPNGKAIAKCFFVNKDDTYTLNQRICSLFSKELNNKFLFYRINRHPYYLEFDNGVGQTNLRKDEVLNCPIFFPNNILEQTKIANFLTAIDTKIQQLNQKKALLEEYKKGVMQQLFSQEIRFKDDNGENYPDWEEKKLGEVAPLQRGFDLPVDKIVNGKFPVVFSNGILKFHNEYKVKAPGVVTGRSGTIGKVTFVSTNYWPHNTSLWVTDFQGNYPEFIYHFYKYYDLSRFGAGSGVPTLNRNDVHSQIESFPSLPEQTKIANFLTVIDTKIETVAKQIEQTQAYKKGLLQQLFI